MRILLCMGVISSTLLGGCVTLPPLPEDSNAISTTTSLTTVIPSAGQQAATSPKSNILQCPGVIKYRPQPAYSAHSYTKYKIGDDGKLKVEQENWPAVDAEDRNRKIHRLLPNIASDIAVKETKSEANLGGLFSGKTRRYNVIIDFAKYRTEPTFAVGSGSIDADTIPSFYSRIGAGLRVEYQIDTVDAGLSLADLIGIAASVKAGRTRGEMTTSIIGMESSEITIISPITEDISDASVRRLIEALATIKAKMHEADAYIDPQFLARLECDASVIEES